MAELGSLCAQPQACFACLLALLLKRCLQAGKHPCAAGRGCRRSRVQGDRSGALDAAEHVRGAHRSLACPQGLVCPGLALLQSPPCRKAAVPRATLPLRFICLVSKAALRQEVVFAAWGAGRAWGRGCRQAHVCVCVQGRTCLCLCFCLRVHTRVCVLMHLCVHLCTDTCVHVCTYTPSAFQLCRRGGNTAASPSPPCRVAPASLELPNMSELLWNCPGRVLPSLRKLFQPNTPWLSHSSLSRGAVVGKTGRATVQHPAPLGTAWSRFPCWGGKEDGFY